MNRAYCTLVCAGVLLRALPVAAADDWISLPSYFTHHPQTGQRVQQYAPIGPFYVYPRADFLSSGYHHTRSSIRIGGSADHYHLVEEWGRPVRPYGEWQFPFRPYSVPYALWGPPWYGFGWGAGVPLPFAYYPWGAHPGSAGPGLSPGGTHPPGPYPGGRPGEVAPPTGPGSPHFSPPPHSGGRRGDGDRQDSAARMR